MISVAFGLVGLCLLFIYGLLGALGVPGGMVTLVIFSTFASSFYELLWVIVITYFASMMGDILAYEISRKVSGPLRKKLRKFDFFNKNELKTVNLIEKRGFFIVFFTRFGFISLCSAVSYLAGLERFNRRKFYVAVIFGEALYAIIYPVLGYSIGETLSAILATINDFLIAVILAVVLIYLIWIFIRRLRRR